MKRAIIVFVKTPLPGRVKTRLEPFLSKDKTVEIYKTFISEIISRCAGLRGISKFVGCFPTKENDFIREVAKTHRFKSFNQRGRDLGEKIISAFKEFLKKGYREIVIIGSDSPTLPLEYIKKAFAELNRNDFVIGPCCDGGLYLVGIKRKIVPGIFQDMPWDTSEVLKKTLEKLNTLDIRFSLLPFWYDIDTIEDLQFLGAHLNYLNKKKGRGRRL